MRKIFSLFFIVAVFGSIYGFAANRALIVGIEKYRDAENINRLLGGENDARSMAALAVNQLGFAQTEVKMLLNEKATAAGLSAEIENWLIKGTKPNDKVFFYFAGHGTQIKDKDGDESDGFDEAIVPFDTVYKNPTQLILDDVINSWIKKMIGRKLLMVFDSCNSGTVSRNLGSENNLSRFIAFPDLVTGKRSIGDTDDYSPVPADASKRDLHPVSQTSTRENPLNNAVIISAAMPYQVAFGFPINGTYRGALTYLFEKILTVETDIKIEKLQNNLRKEMFSLMQTLEKKGMRVRQAGTSQESYQVPSIEILSDCSRGDTTLFNLAESATCRLKNNNSPLKINFRMLNRKSIYFKNEKFVWEVELSESARLYVLVFSEGNIVSCVFPTKSDQENLLTGGKHFFPRRGKPSIVAMPPWGLDIWVALAVKKPLDLCVGQTKYNDWNEVFSKIGLVEFREKVEKVKRSNGGQNILADDEWQVSSLSVETREKP